MTGRIERWRARAADERGSTLMELMVGMLIMLIFLGMFTGAIVLLYQSSNRANALTASAGQTDQAFARLDRSIRYASSISTPGTDAAGWWYVEYLTVQYGTTSAGVSTCTQLRVWPAATAVQLQARSWTAGSSATTTTAWVPWASGITNGNVPAGSTSPPVPFVLVVNGTNVAYEQLTVNLTATSGSPAIPAQTNATFTALNSAATAKAAGTAAVAVCNDVARP